MFWNAKNGRVSIGDTDMDYISFGKEDFNDRVCGFLSK